MAFQINVITYVSVMLLLYIGGFIMLEYGLFTMGRSANCINDKKQYDSYLAMTIAGAVAIVLGFLWQSFMDARVTGMKTTIATAL
jgi:hypothetical protein